MSQLRTHDASPLRGGVASQLRVRGHLDDAAAGEAEQAGSYRIAAVRFNVRQWKRISGSAPYNHEKVADVDCVCTIAEEGPLAVLAGFLRDTGSSLSLPQDVRASSFTAFDQLDTYASHAGWSIAGSSDTTRFASGNNSNEPDGAAANPGTSIVGNVLTVRKYFGTGPAIYDVPTLPAAVGFVFTFQADSTTRLLFMAVPDASLPGGGTDQGYNAILLDGYLEVDLEIIT